MKTYTFFFIFLTLFIFSSCSGGISSVIGGGGSDLPEEVVRGEGLEASFSIDERSERGLYEYELRLENSGKFLIEIRDEEEDLLLTTNPRGADGRSYFTDKSTSAFYEKVFERTGEGLRNTLSSEKIKGTLELKEDVLENPTNKNFDYQLGLEYDYRTEFSNNVLLDMEEKEIRFSDSLTQAAPVKITKVELRLQRDETYNLEFYVENRGKGEEVRIEEAEFKFGTQILFCEVFRTDTKELILPVSDKPQLDEKIKTIIYSCPVNLADFDEDTTTQTTTGGFLDYRYTLEFEGNLNIQPDTGVSFR